MQASYAIKREREREREEDRNRDCKSENKRERSNGRKIVHPKIARLRYVVCECEICY